MLYFTFCIHNHQPVGNFDNVLEEAYENSYRPFLEAVARHPSIRITLHNSGFLLDWIARNHQEYVRLLRALVEAGQVEVMGGGYYEPILSVIPEGDRISQIRLMSDRIEDLFGKRPRGLWLAERVWEPSLPTMLKKAGIEYLLVDDFHFIKSGLEREALGGYYVTEDLGNVVRIFPGSERLRYLIPFKPVEGLMEHLKNLRAFLKRGNAAIYGDDGEKFGVWPGTKKWVFDEGWLKGFLEGVEGAIAEGWLRSTTLAEYMDSERPLGRVYLPATSYMEMGEWSLPAEASKAYAKLHEEIKSSKDGEKIERFLQGGTWRNFFAKYPEANWMHKRMLMVSSLLREKSEKAPDSELLGAASRFLYEAQCNDAYWHGVFGGLYMPHLRTKVYENLIKAENLILQNGPSLMAPYGIEIRDVDADGSDEAVLREREINVFVSPSSGGAVTEIDFRPRAVNFSNTLSRWFEGYHHKLESSVKHAHDPSGTKSIHEMVLVKEEGLERYLKFDNLRRASFRERFIGDGEGLQDFYANTYRELGDFYNGRYSFEAREGKLVLQRTGKVSGVGFTVAKEFRTLGKNTFAVDYRIRRAEPGAYLPLNALFGVEVNLLLPCCDGPACLYSTSPVLLEGHDSSLASTGELAEVEKISLIDRHTAVMLTIETDKKARLWRFPVYTVSLSEAGFEKIYQGSCLLFLYPFEPGPSGAYSAGFRVKAEGLA